AFELKYVPRPKRAGSINVLLETADRVHLSRPGMKRDETRHFITSLSRSAHFHLFEVRQEVVGKSLRHDRIEQPAAEHHERGPLQVLREGIGQLCSVTHNPELLEGGKRRWVKRCNAIHELEHDDLFFEIELEGNGFCTLRHVSTVQLRNFLERKLSSLRFWTLVNYRTID